MSIRPLRKGRLAAYAIVRVDSLTPDTLDWCLRIKVVRVVWSIERAQAETERLQAQAKNGDSYFWQTTQSEIPDAQE
jgi:hypothetical protein